MFFIKFVNLLKSYCYLRDGKCLAEHDFYLAKYFCIIGIFISTTNYFLNEIIKNNEIIKLLNKGIIGYEYKKREYKQILNNSNNYLTPIIKEIRRILLEDENLKIKNNNLRSLIEKEIEYFIEILFNYFNKLIEHLQPPTNIEFYAKLLLKLNLLILTNLYNEFENGNNYLGIYLTKILQNKIEIECNKLIINEIETEQIKSIKNFCQIGMLLYFGNFLIIKYYKYEKKIVVKLINNLNNNELNIEQLKKEIEERNENIIELNKKILKLNNDYLPIWNKAKNILMGNEIINEEELNQEFVNLPFELKTQIEVFI
ncbi:hypothetical protein Mgra_00004727 [Meloidogyne graminicola]|uniref:Uncharacterized protein n=1 Tax=Meloidogyne graminicola TaxID=189291 RepID=A0A8S9ZQS4_9BILA|nr:hypothetical protein Mgra_00004727 [Meloidogyne graminicola]